MGRNPSVLARLLRYGDLASRRRLADEIVAGDAELADLLAETARSEEDFDLRVRCVEVLGLALGSAQPDVAGRILERLLALPVSS